MLHRYRRKANKLKAGKGAMDELAIKELSRLIDYLKSLGWSAEQIVKLLEYITA